MVSRAFPLFFILALGAGCSNPCQSMPRPEAIAESGLDAGADAIADASAPASAEQVPEAHVRIGYAKEKRLCTRLISSRSFREERCAEMKSPIEQATWVDAERMGALLDDGAVVLWEIFDTKAKALKLPSPKSFERPAPRDHEAKLRIGAEASDRRHLWAKASGELWLSRCPWWFLFDAGYCDAWVEARLYPPPLIVETDRWGAPGYKETKQELPLGSPAQGISIEIQEQDGGGDVRVICRNGAGRAIIREESHGSPLQVEVGWLGEHASMYVLRTELDFGEGTHTRLRLMKACSEEEVGSLAMAIRGPDSFWIHDDAGGYAVRYGEGVVGVVAADWVDFAP